MSGAENKKTVVITGASRGIGRACAFKFADAGDYRLVLTAKSNAEALFDTRAEVDQMMPPEDVMSLLCDVANPMTVKLLYANVLQRFGGTDILINNAGVTSYGLLQEMTDDDFETVVQTNLAGVFHMMRGAIPQMLQKGEGSIVSVSSVYGESGAACEAVYAATKAGVNTLTRSVAKELANSNICVNAVAPGYVDTEMNAHLSEEDVQALLNEIPLGRALTPEEVADYIYSVATSLSKKNGEILAMDGGWAVG